MGVFGLGKGPVGVSKLYIFFLHGMGPVGVRFFYNKKRILAGKE